MKIAMFTDAYFPRINGVAISVKSYAQELTKLGHQVCVVCLEYSEEQQKSALFDSKSEDEKSPFKIIRVPSTYLIFSKEDRAARFDKWTFVKKQMKLFKPDVIHINSEWVIGYFGAMFARNYHVPYVFTFHTLWEDYLANYMHILPKSGCQKLGRDVVKFYLKRADEIIAPTRRIEQVVSDYKVDRPVDLLPTGIPEELFNFSLPRFRQIQRKLFSKFPQLKGKKVLLYVGRVVKEKNLAFLLDVLKETLKTNPNTALLFVGGGPYLDELAELAEQMGLAQNTAFAGYAAREDLIYFYKCGSIFVFPSLTETQGLVTIEAMMAGLPVVAIGERGTLDVMQGDNGGFMVKNDLQEFSAKVSALLNDENLFRQKAAEGEKWSKQWSIKELTPKLVEFYQKAIDCKQAELKKISDEKNRTAAAEKPDPEKAQ